MHGGEQRDVALAMAMRGNADNISRAISHRGGRFDDTAGAVPLAGDGVCDKTVCAAGGAKVANAVARRLVGGKFGDSFWGWRRVQGRKGWEKRTTRVPAGITMAYLGWDRERGGGEQGAGEEDCATKAVDMAGGENRRHRSVAQEESRHCVLVKESSELSSIYRVLAEDKLLSQSASRYRRRGIETSPGKSPSWTFHKKAIWRPKDTVRSET